MKRTLLSLVGSLVVSSLVSVAAPQCVPGTLSDYIRLGSEGCSIGIATFANFGYAVKASGGAKQIPPDQVKVNPVDIPFNPQLSFSANWGTASGQTQDSFIKYAVMPVTTGPNTGILTLQMGLSQVGTFATVGVQESTDIGGLQVLTKCTEFCGNFKKTDTLQFWPLGALQVIDHVSLVSRSGMTSLSSFRTTFDLCPLCA